MGKTYESIPLETSLGKTHVWGLNTKNEEPGSVGDFSQGQEPLLFFWDFDNGLISTPGQNLRIYLC